MASRNLRSRIFGMIKTSAFYGLALASVKVVGRGAVVPYALSWHYRNDKQERYCGEYADHLAQEGKYDLGSNHAICSGMLDRWEGNRRNDGQRL